MVLQSNLWAAGRGGRLLGGFRPAGLSSRVAASRGLFSPALGEGAVDLGALGEFGGPLLGAAAAGMVALAAWQAYQDWKDTHSFYDDAKDHGGGALNAAGKGIISPAGPFQPINGAGFNSGWKYQNGIFYALGSTHAYTSDPGLTPADFVTIANDARVWNTVLASPNFWYGYFLKRVVQPNPTLQRQYWNFTLPKTPPAYTPKVADLGAYVYFPMTGAAGWSVSGSVDQHDDTFPNVAGITGLRHVTVVQAGAAVHSAPADPDYHGNKDKKHRGYVKAAALFHTLEEVGDIGQILAAIYDAARSALLRRSQLKGFAGSTLSSFNAPTWSKASWQTRLNIIEGGFLDYGFDVDKLGTGLSAWLLGELMGSAIPSVPIAGRSSDLFGQIGTYRPWQNW